MKIDRGPERDNYFCKINSPAFPFGHNRTQPHSYRHSQREREREVSNSQINKQCSKFKRFLILSDKAIVYFQWPRRLQSQLFPSAPLAASLSVPSRAALSELQRSLTGEALWRLSFAPNSPTRPSWSITKSGTPTSLLAKSLMEL